MNGHCSIYSKEAYTSNWYQCHWSYYYTKLKGKVNATFQTSDESEIDLSSSSATWNSYYSFQLFFYRVIGAGRKLLIAGPVEWGKAERT